MLIYSNVAEDINKVPATHLHDTGPKSHVSTSQASVSSRLLSMEKSMKEPTIKAKS